MKALLIAPETRQRIVEHLEHLQADHVGDECEETWPEEGPQDCAAAVAADPGNMSLCDVCQLAADIAFLKSPTFVKEAQVAPAVQGEEADRLIGRINEERKRLLRPMYFFPWKVLTPEGHRTWFQVWQDFHGSVDARPVSTKLADVKELEMWLRGALAGLVGLPAWETA